LNFTKHPITKDVTKKIDSNAIIASVRNLVMTNHYEKPFAPTFGSNIRGMLFEPVSPITAVNLQKEIEVLLNNYEPRVKIDELLVSMNEDAQRYDVYLRFYIVNSIRPVTITLFLNRLR
jgi:phage baseplate assembly protein W